MSFLSYILKFQKFIKTRWYLEFDNMYKTFGMPISTISVATLQKNMKTDYYSTALVLALKDG